MPVIWNEPSPTSTIGRPRPRARRAPAPAGTAKPMPTYRRAMCSWRARARRTSISRWAATPTSLTRMSDGRRNPSRRSARRSQVTRRPPRERRGTNALGTGRRPPAARRAPAQPVEQVVERHAGVVAVADAQAGVVGQHAPLLLHPEGEGAGVDVVDVHAQLQHQVGALDHPPHAASEDAPE